MALPETMWTSFQLQRQLDCSFPNVQFSLSGFHDPIGLGMNNRNVGLWTSCLYKGLNAIKDFDNFYKNIQVIPFEINLRKGKWFFVIIYNPPSTSNQYFLDVLGDLMDSYSQ